MFTLAVYVNKNKKATPFEVAFPMLTCGEFYTYPVVMRMMLEPSMTFSALF
jgi:hypothetical protein